jgi:hypothetical protein
MSAVVFEIEADAGSASDPILLEYLDAEDGVRADQALRVLIESEAAPIIQRVLLRKNATTVEREDLASAAREQILRQLTSLRRGERETPIRDFRNYVASVAYSAWAEHLRNEHPQHSMLLNRVRYLLENRTRHQRLALWIGEAGENLCGFAEWKDKRCANSSPKLQWLLVDVTAAAAQAFGRREVGRDDLVFAVTQLFTWLEQPIELRDLVSVLVEVMGLHGSCVGEESANEVLSPYGSPREETIWKEYLIWLWRQMEKLSPRQCVSFLLNSNVIRDFELFGLASIQTLAPRFAMAPDHLAVLWQRLPLDDLALAVELQCTRQQVINLRRVARDLLGKAWRDFVAETSDLGNTPSRFTSSSK